MPNKVEQFAPWQAMQWLHQQLMTIDHAHGYNTQPFVTMDRQQYQQAGTTCAVVVECEANDPQEHGLNNTVMMSRFVIEGNVQITMDIPRRAAMALEQDVRTAIATAMAALRAAKGKAYSLQWGPCAHDAGDLSPAREAGFRLNLTLIYPQGSTW
jgi:hypothetical protein